MCRFEERTSPRGRKHRAGVLLPSASPRERATPALCFLPLEFGPFLEPTHREELFLTLVNDRCGVRIFPIGFVPIRNVPIHIVPT